MTPDMESNLPHSMDLILNPRLLSAALEKLSDYSEVFIFPRLKPLGIVQDEVGIVRGGYLVFDIRDTRLLMRYILESIRVVSARVGA
jgi:hypothetical protein